MTDPSLTPEQEEAVRRALREVRPAGPPPAEVVARLDATLADLTADRRAEARPAADEAPDQAPAADLPAVAPVVPLATRRRRWAGAALVAAAAVVVAGVGLGPLVDSWQAGDGGGDDSTAATSEEADDGADSGEYDAGTLDGGGVTDRGPRSPDEDRPLAGAPETAVIGVPRIRPAHFKRDVTAVRDSPTVLGEELSGARDPQSQFPPDSGAGKSRSTMDDCAPMAGAGERSVAVTYRRQPATLLFRAPEDGSQVVELHLCRDVGLERVTTLTVP